MTEDTSTVNASIVELKEHAHKVQGFIMRITLIGEELDRLSQRIRGEWGDTFTIDMMQDKLSLVHRQFTSAQNLHADLCAIVSTAERMQLSYFTQRQWDGIVYSYEDLDEYLSKRIDRLYLLSSQSRNARSGEGSLHSSSPISRTFQNTSHHEALSFIRLPRLELTPFDGSYDSWQNFSDSFSVAVDKHPALSPAQKLQHLKASLQGEASNILSSLPITDSNYATAWKTLKESYENKRVLITNYLNKLSSLPSVQQDNLSKLKQMRDTIKVSLDALNALDCPTDNWGPLLIHMLIQKFSIALKREWEKSLCGSTNYPELKQLNAFINNQVHILENLEIDKDSTKVDNGHGSKKLKANLNTSVTSTDSCPLCSEPHQVARCSIFAKYDVKQRHKCRVEKKLCSNCLSPNHAYKDCQSQYTCKTCGKRHHTLLHYESKPKRQQANFKSRAENNNPSPETAASTSDNNSGSSSTNHLSFPGSVEVMIATALVRLIAPNGRTMIIRAIIDPGSESSFISESVAQLLKLPKYHANVTIKGLQGTQTSAPKFSTRFSISSTQQNSRRYQLEAYILQAITSYRPKSFIPENHKELRGLILADPQPAGDIRIELLLGADITGQLMLDGVVRLSNSKVTAQATTLGWILSGPVKSAKQGRTITVQHATTDTPLEELLKKFFETEEFSIEAPLSEEEERCERNFRETTTRDASGRFQVRLPFKSDTSASQLGESKSIALSSWKRVEASLDKKPALREQYDAFMQEYLALGHMEEITPNDVGSSRYVYLPHHAVIREQSLTTSLRVVFDASRETRSGLSINDVLCTGKKLQNDVSDVITYWRNHQYVLIADIAKMFRQITIHPDDQKFQCIVWNKQNDLAVRSYKLKTVTYGTKPATFLANRVIKAVVEAHGQEFPLAIEPLSKSIYVDDVLFGANTPEQTIKMREQIEATLKKGCLELRKWSSNSSLVLPAAESSSDSLYLEPEDKINKRVLGICWDPKLDSFSVTLDQLETSVITKRNILSHIARLFDPLGWLSPIVVRAKVVMQQLWIEKVGWDDMISDSLKRTWLELCEELAQLSNLHIPRFVGAGDKPARVQLIGFSDASRRAFSAAVYLYIDFESGKTKTNLLSAKTRVAPVNTISIPRLELCGAVILAKLMHKVQGAWLSKLDGIQCFTDSRIVLDWLNKHASNWHTFVANRVALIQTLLPKVKWKHILSKQNPADLNSRGVKISELLASELWWTGPNLPSEDLRDLSVEENLQIQKEVEKEARPSTTLHVATDKLPSYLLKHSSWLKLTRVIGFCLKYLQALKQRKDKTPIQQLPLMFVSRELIREAQCHIFKVLQQNAFSAELKAIKTNTALSKGSKLYSLSPFLDKSGLLRVGGRLQESNLSYEAKYPIILPQGPVTNRLIFHFHVKTLHGGIQLTLNALRQEFWIIHARNATKAIISKCVTCTRHAANAVYQKMCALPEPRCTPSRVFSHVGVDYAGPLAIRNAPGRSQKSHKAYLAVFVCFATRAIHLEVVNAYSTEAFMAALKCFIARRSAPNTIYSDRGTNFQGAEAELAKAFRRLPDDSNLHNALASEGIKWKFNPSSAPHMGGLWESEVRAVKHHLGRIMGKFTPTWEEMRTIICQIEACLNSRPLTPLKDQATEELALTPGHFLVGTSLLAMPEPDVLDVNMNLLRRWQIVTQITQTF